MKLKIEDRVAERIKVESRSLALITLPGMGLSSILRTVRQQNFGLFLELKPELIIDLWEKEYKLRTNNRRYVLHAAIISVIKQQFSLQDPSTTDLFTTNLTRFFNNTRFLAEYNPIYVVVDNFEVLPFDLAVIILDETKVLDDHRDDPTNASIKALKFIIGGTFDFQTLYQQKAKKDDSPGTNFGKHRPHEFLLAESEAKEIIEDLHKGFNTDDIRFINEWTNGYLHYVISLSGWIDAQRKEYGNECSLQQLLIKLRVALEEGEAKSIFSYCYNGWKKFKDDDEALSLLCKAVSAGYISTVSQKAKDLVCGGYFIQKGPQTDVYCFSNQLVEMFARQKMAEKNKVLPIGDSACWIIKEQNIKAYSQLLEIENRLRNFIGDTLFNNCGCGTINDVVEKIKDSLDQSDPEHKKGTKWKDDVSYRKISEERSLFSSGDTFDSLLMYLDFADLGEIISVTGQNFNSTFVLMLPKFLDELNYIRRRIAHNRPITDTQLSDLISRWTKIQRMMSK